MPTLYGVTDGEDELVDFVLNLELKKCCAKCQHYGGGSTCKAFPKGIPAEILSGQVVHDKPYDGDQDIQFTPTVEEALKSLSDEQLYEIMDGLINVVDDEYKKRS